MKPLTKIQKFAKGKPCQLRIPGVCRETPEHEDTCLCHAPHPNRGGMRKDDHWGSVGCMPCHDWIDGRDGGKYYGNVAKSGIDMEFYWFGAIHEWQAMLMEADLMQVEGIEPVRKQLPRR